MTGIGPTIRLCGETVILRALRLRDYGLIEAEILRRRGNPFDLFRDVCRVLGSDRRHSTVEARNRVPHTLFEDLFFEIERRWRHVSFCDLDAWLGTWPGRLFVLWLMVQSANPQRYTLERVQRLAATSDWREIRAAMELALGEDERAAVDWIADECDGNSEPIPWTAIFRRLASEPYSMDAEAVCDLTLHQLRMYVSDEDRCAARVHFESASEFEAWRRRRTERASSALDNLCCGRQWHMGSVPSRNG